MRCVGVLVCGLRHFGMYSMCASVSVCVQICVRMCFPAFFLQHIKGFPAEVLNAFPCKQNMNREVQQTFIKGTVSQDFEQFVFIIH